MDNIKELYKVRKTEIMSLLLLIALSTWSLSIVNLFYPSVIIQKGTASEFLGFAFDIIMALLFWLGLVYFTITELKKLKKEKKGSVLKTIVIGLGFSIFVYCLLNYFDMSTIMDRVGEFRRYYFIPLFFLINLSLLIGVYFTNTNTKRFVSLLESLVMFNIFILGIYMVTVSFVKVLSFEKIYENDSNMMRTIFPCEGTYPVVKYQFFIIQKDCPYKDKSKDEQLMILAENGNSHAYGKMMGSIKTNDEKTKLATKYYESTKHLLEKSWIENNIPSLYNISMVKSYKEVASRYRENDLKFIELVNKGDSTKINELRNELMKDKKTRSELIIYYKL